MNKMILSILMLVTIAIQSCNAQIKNAKNETVKVFGNCNMCKSNIETAAFNKKISIAVWDKENKTALLTYDSAQTTTDAILKEIALAGYDNQYFLAPNDAYHKLEECCQYERKNVGQNLKAETIKHTLQKNTVKNILTESPLEIVYTSYFAIKNALTKDNGATAAAGAKELFNAVENVKMESLTTAQHTIWMKYRKDISNNAKLIKEVSGTQNQREHFDLLSAAMIEVIKSIKPDYTIYIDHCPMYNENKGADWISKENGIKNPYYGAMMLTCGSTKEIIK